MRLRRTGKRGNKVRSRNTRKRQSWGKLRGGAAEGEKREFYYGDGRERYAKRPEFYYGKGKRMERYLDTKMTYTVFVNFIENMERIIDGQHEMIHRLDAIRQEIIKGQEIEEK